MFMRSLGQFSSPLVLGFMARTAGASDIRFPYEGAALLSVVMMGVFWVNVAGEKQPGKTGGLLKPKFNPELCRDMKKLPP
ncbi:MAG: hypothetical protein ACLTBV_23335 [Enterocloster bolteae]